MAQHTNPPPSGTASPPLDLSPEGFLARGRSILAAQPFSMLLGAELHSLSPALCELHLPLTASLQQHVGFAHGGVGCYAADSALTFAGAAALRIRVVTSEFKINYVRPAIGEQLSARAKGVHAGRTQAVCCWEVFVLREGVEKLCAIAQGTIVAQAPAPGNSA